QPPPARAQWASPAAEGRPPFRLWDRDWRQGGPRVLGGEGRLVCGGGRVRRIDRKSPESSERAALPSRRWWSGVCAHPHVVGWTSPRACARSRFHGLAQRPVLRMVRLPEEATMPTSPAPQIPEGGQPIVHKGGRLSVPDRPILPFIEGDGTGPDIWRASQRVLDAAVAKAYGGKRRIAWMEVYAGDKAKNLFDNWLPDETVEAFQKYLVGIKGPLTTPVGGGIRSLNVALRQMLDLYVCLRPVRYFKGVPSPVKHPEKVDMVIFRENTEDIYAGIEY